MTTARQRSPPCVAAAASDLLRDDARHHLANVGSGALAGRSLEPVFVEDLVVDHVAKSQLPLHRPVGEALLGTPDDIHCVAGVRPETPRDYGLVQRPTGELRGL